MRYSDVVRLFAVIASAYPTDRNFADASDETVALWADMLKDMPNEVVIASIKAHIASSKFPPTIAEIRRWGGVLTHPEAMTESEAWAIVRKAISYYDAKAKFDALPPILKEIVGGHSQLRDWALLDVSELPVIASNFMRSYRAKMAYHKEQESIPAAVRELIQAASVGMLPEGEI